MAERKGGRIYFGSGMDQKSFPDPLYPSLRDALWCMRYEPGRVTSSDRYAILAAAEAYLHLTTYPLGVEHTVKDLRQIRRALKADGYGPPPERE